jgi:hypothetical protein
VIASTKQVVVNCQLLRRREVHVESLTTGNRNACRDDGERGCRRDRVGADADIALEEGRTVPGAG